MNLAEFSLRNRTTVMVFTVCLLFGGMVSFGGLARFEDPEFTIKEAIVITPYPGATPEQVELEVSDRVEKAIQELAQLEWIESTNYRGASRIRARILDQYDKVALPQVWDELRRKVGDIQGSLPPGAGPSVVNDDFGDVWGIFFALYGDEYSYADLHEVAKLLQRERSYVTGFAYERSDQILAYLPSMGLLNQPSLRAWRTSLTPASRSLVPTIPKSWLIRAPETR